MTRRLVKFLVSGFGPFLGVERNPTQSLVEYLASRTGPGGALLSSGCEYELIQVLGTAVIRVSAEDVDAHLAQLVAVLQQEADIPRAAVSVPCAGSRPAATAPTAPAASGNSAAPVRPFSSPSVDASSTRGSSIVLLHLGVANTATTYRLESRAYNCATFRVPDANGWSPQRQELESGRPGGLEGWVGSALPLEEMAKALTAKGHGDVLVSTNAGRFICNW
ncbi:hypothetical protein CHLRE_14g623439v5 [Chlamydomonas reinhardtii]|nr:uncharacterized protein CHLRE_14g623439v5 [Chlamydomonas reinhardtii]PNW73217.1 hypothetical protein CHLRE_14g623439v5 [Chlamydomonas reinhardtii]